MEKGVKKLGDILVDAELITEDQLKEALLLQKQNYKPLGEVLMDLGYVTETQLYKALEYLFQVPYINLLETTPEKDALSLINENVAQKHILIPVAATPKTITVVMKDPLNYEAIDDVALLTGREVKIAISPQKDITNAIDRYYSNEGAKKAVEDLSKEFAMMDLSGLAEMVDSQVANAPVVRLVNSIILQAVKSNASDIHIEPEEKDMRVRFRIDGELNEVMRSSNVAHPAIITRIKIIGKMDIAEKRVPQDGRVETVIDDRSIDMRLSILPTVYGEKVVIRILGGQSQALTRAQLGLSEANYTLFDNIIKSPNGIILVSGPTGSGKTTTLYTVLKELNRPEVNIITVEDPVEYKLEGINQVQVNTKAGLTFVSGLRSILRQDPDIIMIGEIRDAETAQIAIRASITGHLVLSTIHTNDSASSVARLVDMGIEPYLVSSSVVGVIAQRLVKKICPHCKVSYRPDHAEMMMLKLKEPKMLYRGEGCNYCNNTGYKGRTAIHEIMVVNREIRELIDRRATTDQLRQMAARFGTKTLRESCIELVLDGTTTTAELTKVTYSIEG